MRVFLGGTCNGSQWRDRLIPMLRCDFFNPVVPEWTRECQEREIRERDEADIRLYVLTPRMAGFYSVAEAVEDSIKRASGTILWVLPADDNIFWTKAQNRSLHATMRLVRRNGGTCGHGGLVNEFWTREREVASCAG